MRYTVILPIKVEKKNQTHILQPLSVHLNVGFEGYYRTDLEINSAQFEEVLNKKLAIFSRFYVDFSMYVVGMGGKCSEDL